MANPESKFVVSAEDRATATLRKVAAEFGGLGKASSAANQLLGQFGNGLLAGLAGGLSVAGLTAAVKSVANLQDQFGKLSQQVGIGVQSLTELDYAAKLSDVATDELSTGVVRLTSRMGDVIQGSKEAEQAFDALGIKVRQSDGTMRSSEDVLKDVADRFASMEDGSTKTALAVELFGRAGAKLIPLLNLGRAGLEKLAAEARSLGVVFDEKAAKAAEEFNDNLTRLESAATGLKIELLQGLIPSLTSLTGKFIEATRASGGFLQGLATWASVSGDQEANPTKAIAEIEAALARLEKMRSELDPEKGFANRLNDWIFGDVGDLDKQIAVQRARLAYLRGIVLRDPALQLPLLDDRTGDYLPPVQFGKEDKKKPKKPRLEQATLTPQQAAIIDAANDYDKASRASEVFALKLQVLDAKFFAGEGTVEDYTAAMQDLTKSTVTAGADGSAALKTLAEGWLDGIDPMRGFLREIEQVEQALSRGLISPEQAEAIKKRMADALQPVSEADAWAVQAAKNIQDALGENLYQMLDGNFENIGKSFGNMLKRMAAEAMAAQLGRTLFGDVAKTGNVGGWLGEGLKWVGGLFGVPSHADGLDYVPYDGYIAKLHKGERVQTAAEARGDRGKQIIVQQSISFGGNVDRAQMAAYAKQIEQQTIASVRRANQSGDYALTGG